MRVVVRTPDDDNSTFNCVFSKHTRLTQLIWLNGVSSIMVERDWSKVTTPLKDNNLHKLSINKNWGFKWSFEGGMNERTNEWKKKKKSGIWKMKPVQNCRHPEGEYFGEKIKGFFFLLNPFDKEYKRYTKSRKKKNFFEGIIFIVLLWNRGWSLPFTFFKTQYCRASFCLLLMMF